MAAVGSGFAAARRKKVYPSSTHIVYTAVRKNATIRASDKALCKVNMALIYTGRK